MEEELLKLIKDSELEEADKSEWEIMINQLPFKVVTEMYEFLSHYPQEIIWFNDFYRRKQEAFKELAINESKGNDMLSKIYMEETDKLINLVS
jgi:hypothetical protein